MRDHFEGEKDRGKEKEGRGKERKEMDGITQPITPKMSADGLLVITV